MAITSSDYSTPRERAAETIATIAAAYDCSDAIIDSGSDLFEQFQRADLLTGRSAVSMAAAAVYIASKMHHEPISPSQLADLVDDEYADEKQIIRDVRYVNQEMGLGIEVQSPADWIHSHGDRLGLSTEARERALELIEAGEDAGVTVGKSPSGVAAGAAYAATLLCNEHVIQEVVADVFGVSEVTIRNRYQELLEIQEVGA